MKHIDFYLDFISPYAHLAFEHLPEALEGLSYSVAYKPVLLGALLKQHGQLGPAEIPSKRSWTYRHVLWLGHTHGIQIEMPASHPYNPLAHLRLAVATERRRQHQPPRGRDHFSPRVARRRRGGRCHAARRADRAAQAEARSGQRREQGLLKRNTDEALQLGVFGTPAYVVDGRLFWGFDGLAMLRAYLAGDAWFDGPQWAGADQRPSLLRSSKG
jgi:2-hydroxychromene-2-carboxylate isomerase